MESKHILARLFLAIALIFIVYLILRIVLPSSASAEEPPVQEYSASPEDIVSQPCETSRKNPELQYGERTPFRDTGTEWCLNDYCMQIEQSWSPEDFPWKDGKHYGCFGGSLLYGFRLPGKHEGEEPEIGVVCKLGNLPRLFFYSEKNGALNGSFWMKQTEDIDCLCDHNGCAPLGQKPASPSPQSSPSGN